MKLPEVDIPRIDSSCKFSDITEFGGTKKAVLIYRIQGPLSFILLMPLTDNSAFFKQLRADPSYADWGIFATLAAQRHTQ